MTTNVQAVRRHLEEAYRLLDGSDELSEKTRQALDILIDGLLAAEYRTKCTGAKIINFPLRRGEDERVRQTSSPAGK